MRRAIFLVFLLCAVSAFAGDDSDTVNPLPAANSTFITSLQQFLKAEDANRFAEQGFNNMVSVAANPQSCLGVAGPGLTMTPTHCIAYAAGYRVNDTGSITFPNASTCYVIIDENTSGANGAWVRATGTHYLTSCANIKPAVPSDGQNIMTVTTSDGSVTAVTDTRTTVPIVGGGGGGGGGSTPTGLVNNVINVTDPAYNAKGDCVTDDTSAIQSAIDGACGQTPPSQAVYLPATPNAGCYLISSPLLLNCTGIKLFGAGVSQTRIRSPGFFGPELLVQGAETGWKPPLTTSVTVLWAAAHAYAQYADIVDSNGNIEVQEAAACTSGGSAPTWPTTQPNTVADNTCTWALATTGGTKQIATGTGGSLDAADPEFFNGAGYGSNNANVEVGNAADVEQVFNGGAAGIPTFTIEYYAEVFAGLGANVSSELGMDASYPEASNVNAFDISLNPFAGGSCTNNNPCYGASANIGGVNKVISVNTDPVTLNVPQHIALSYDGTTMRLFVAGTMVGSVAATGNWSVPPYESFEFANTVAQNYPGMNAARGLLPAFYDSIRVSNTARYTSNFTPPTAKFASDGNTLFLSNFPTTAPTGTIQASVNGTPAYIPIETSNGSHIVNPGYIQNMDLSGNGIYANWMINSLISDISFDNIQNSCITLANNDFVDTIRQTTCQISPNGSKTSVGYAFLNQSNNNLYDHLHCDGPYSCVDQVSGSGTYILTYYADRGQAIYPFVFIAAQANVVTPTTDIEDAAANFLATVYSRNAFAPIEIQNGQLIAPAGGNGSFLAIDGGAPIVAIGTDFAGTTPTQFLNVINNPTAPVVIKDATVPAPMLLTNTGKAKWIILDPPVPTAIVGTSGTVSCTETSDAGGLSKSAVCTLSGYAETGAAQTYTFQHPFAQAPNVLQACTPYYGTATTTTLTLPANAAMSAESCQIEARGQ